MLYTIFGSRYLTLYIFYQEKEKIPNELPLLALRATGVKLFVAQLEHNHVSRIFYLFLHEKVFHNAGILSLKQKF